MATSLKHEVGRSTPGSRGAFGAQDLEPARPSAAPAAKRSGGSTRTGRLDATAGKIHQGRNPLERALRTAACDKVKVALHVPAVKRRGEARTG